MDAERLPAVICHDGSVLHDPTFAEVAGSHGIHTRPSPEVHDLAIVGAGPAGLAAAVYGASEGLRALVVEPLAIGGQAGTSSMIRNYLGFPRGVSGGELAHRAWEQAVLFGADFVFTQRATALATRGNEHLIALADGSEAVARAVMVAAGVEYRRLGIPALERLVGAGVFYGAAGVEAPAMAGEEVYVVGAANSAGQAALNLARHAKKVVVLVRAHRLEDTMSQYLVDRILSAENIDVRFRTEVVAAAGDGHLETLTLADRAAGTQEQVPCTALFVFIGAAPRTDWLGDTVLRDSRGFVVTGQELMASGGADRWPLARPPFALETNVPGVFAAGDVRLESMKRVASAVGEGAMAVHLVHRYLATV